MSAPLHVHSVAQIGHLGVQDADIASNVGFSTFRRMDLYPVLVEYGCAQEDLGPMLPLGSAVEDIILGTA
jgi:hypothetical protein